MLSKEVELPLFCLGQYTSRDGTVVDFNESLLQQLAKNTNFVLGSKILQPPVGYDHPAGSSDAHGVLTGARYSNGVLYVRGRNWSDRLVSDVRQSKRLSYSGEFDDKFSYHQQGTGAKVEVGPTVIGLAVLGATRPAIKALKPLSEAFFAEMQAALASVGPADWYMVQQELRTAKVVALGSEGTRHFAEIDNDQRFSDTERKKGDDMEESEVQKLIAKAIADERAVGEKKLADLEAIVKANTVDANRATEVAQFSEQVVADKKVNKGQVPKLSAILMHPSVANNKELDGMIRAFAESASSIVLPGGQARKKPVTESGAVRKTGKEFSADDGDEGDDEGGALANLTVKDFSEMGQTTDGEKKVSEALREFCEKFPNKVRGRGYAEKLELLQRYIREQEDAV